MKGILRALYSKHNPYFNKYKKNEIPQSNKISPVCYFFKVKLLRTEAEF